MTEKEVIERLNRFKAIKVLYGNTFAMHIEYLKTLQKDIEIILNVLKEKNRIIKKQSVNNKKLKDKLRGYRKLVKLKDKHLLKQEQRIKELEEENKEYSVQLTDEQYSNLIDIVRKKAKQKFKQKVINKIQEMNKEEARYGDEWGYIACKRQVVKELLEEM